jgi:hypothetical protein
MEERAGWLADGEPAASSSWYWRNAAQRGLTIYTSITRGFVAEMRRLGVTPHVAQNTARSGGSAIDGRTNRHEGYAKSINSRRGIEKIFGWILTQSSPKE